MARLALALGALHRPAEIRCRAARAKRVKDGWLHFTQFKGRERKPITLDIPVIDELQAIIDATACGKGDLPSERAGPILHRQRIRQLVS